MKESSKPTDPCPQAANWLTPFTILLIKAYQRFVCWQSRRLTLHPAGLDALPATLYHFEKKSCCRHSAKTNHQTFHG